MKKKIFSIVVLSTIALTTIAPITDSADADEYDNQIAQKSSEVDSLKSQESVAQAKVDEVQATINSIQTKSADLKAQISTLETQSKKLSKEVDELNSRIIERSETIRNQARSVQTDGSVGNYLDVILDSKSISDAIARIQAVNKIVSANNQLLTEQKEDKKVVLEKQKENATKINARVTSQADLAKQEQSMKTQQAELKAAQVSLSLSRATAEGDIQRLKQEQATAQVAAKKAAEEEAARAQARAAAEKAAQEVVATPNLPSTDENYSAGNGGGQSSQPTRPSPGGGKYRPDASSYSWGQCTWYVKTQFGSRCGDFWGDGGQWAGSAAADGIPVSSTPAPNTIAVFPPSAENSYYGHVAVVNSVSGGNITITECNYGGEVGRVNTRTISAAGLMFIYC